jgi:integrase/recombinase XerD
MDVRVYDNVFRKYARETGVSAKIEGLRVHSLRATAATMRSTTRPISPRCRNGSANANVSTTRLYDRRKVRPEDPDL